MLRDETVALARELMGKNPVALALTKQAMRKVKTMDAPQAYEYQMTKIHELMFAEPEQTRNRGSRNSSIRRCIDPVSRL